MEADLARVRSLLKPGFLLWCYYPKGTSGIQTDLTRDKGWDRLLGLDVQWLTLVSFNDTWSAFAVRGRRMPIKRSMQGMRFAKSSTTPTRLQNRESAH